MGDRADSGIVEELIGSQRTAIEFFQRIGLFVVLWTVVWAVEFGIITMSQRVGALNNGWIYAVLIAIFTAGTSRLTVYRTLAAME